MRKKATSIICLLLVLSLGLSACGSNPQVPADTKPGPEQTSSEPEIPVVDIKDISELEEVEVTEPKEEENKQLSKEELEKIELTEKKKNSIAMLNYLAALSQEINASRNNRLFLEEAYASIVNNTNPQITELTESYLVSLLDTIENYRIIKTKRERLQLIYAQNKAKAIRSAIPNPIAILGAANSLDIKRLLISSVYMAVDSITSYNAYKSEIEQEYMKDGWELDDDEAANLHDSRKRAFSFMIDTIRDEELPGVSALNEKSIKNFVENKNNENVYQKVQFLESQKSTYEHFGSYWLALADGYYEKGDNTKCLEALATYEDIQCDIFRKDYYFAQMIPKAIVAASAQLSDNEYIEYADTKLQQLTANTDIDDWALRYFAAQMYIDLYSKTNKGEYLSKAYELSLSNVNYLLKEQKNLNETYKADVKEVDTPDKATKDEKKAIKDYNKAMKDKRATELAPVYEPLALNCELLFALSEKVTVTDATKETVNGMLKGAFISRALNNKYQYGSSEISCTAEFKKDDLILPVEIPFEDCIVIVSANDNGEETTFDDWEVKKVNRDSKKGFDATTVTMTSKLSGKFKWKAGMTATIKIYPATDENYCVAEMKFNAVERTVFGVSVPVLEFEQVK